MFNVFDAVPYYTAPSADLERFDYLVRSMEEKLACSSLFAHKGNKILCGDRNGRLGGVGQMVIGRHPQAPSNSPKVPSLTTVRTRWREGKEAHKGATTRDRKATLYKDRYTYLE